MADKLRKETEKENRLIREGLYAAAAAISNLQKHNTWPCDQDDRDTRGLRFRSTQYAQVTAWPCDQDDCDTRGLRFRSTQYAQITNSHWRCPAQAMD